MNEFTDDGNKNERIPHSGHQIYEHSLIFFCSGFIMTARDNNQIENNRRRGYPMPPRQDGGWIYPPVAAQAQRPNNRRQINRPSPRNNGQ